MLPKKINKGKEEAVRFMRIYTDVSVDLLQQVRLRLANELSKPQGCKTTKDLVAKALEHYLKSKEI